MKIPQEGYRFEILDDPPAKVTHKTSRQDPWTNAQAIFLVILSLTSHLKFGFNKPSLLELQVKLRDEKKRIFVLYMLYFNKF